MSTMCFTVAERLDVVDDGRAHVEAEHGGKVRRLDARVGALALERFDEAGFLAADVGARAAMDVDFEIVAGAADIPLPRKFFALASAMAFSRIFAPRVNSPRI